MTLALDAINPALTVNDLEASLDFYENILGFRVQRALPKPGRPDRRSRGAGGQRRAAPRSGRRPGKDRAKGVGFRLYCTTSQDIDELAAAIKARGGELTQEPTDEPWGTRDFAVTDPDGFKISISTPMTS